MADQRIAYTEEMVGSGHPTKSDTLNRLTLVEHTNEGKHLLGDNVSLTLGTGSDFDIVFDGTNLKIRSDPTGTPVTILESILGAGWKNVAFTKKLTGDHTYSGITVQATAGHAVTFGQVAYLKSDGKYYRSVNNSTTTMPVALMALESIGVDDEGTWLVVGYVRDASWASGNWNPGDPIYAAATCGTLTKTQPSTTGDQVQQIGRAEHAIASVHATLMWFDPSMGLPVIEAA